MKSSRKNQIDFFQYLRIPRFLEMPAIGIDISDGAIRFVELLKEGKNFIPHHFGERKLAPGVVVSGSIINKDEVVKALASISKEEKYKFVKASLPESKVYVFNISLPGMPEEDISDAIVFRIEDNAPISASEAIFDYTIIGKNEKNEIEVSVTAVQESVILDYIDLYKRAFLIPRSFELESRAISRALIKQDDPRTYLIVHIGENKTVFSIVRAGVVRFTSTLYVGSNNLTDAIGRTLVLNAKDAEILKNKYIATEKGGEKVFESISGALAAIKDEVNKLLIYWFTHKAPGTPGIQKIDEIILSGKDSNIPGVLEYMSRNVKVPVKIANPWATCFSYDDVIPNVTAGEALDYVTSIGLSLPKKFHA
jgi:type IV pilus assembly protein PilM